MDDLLLRAATPRQRWVAAIAALGIMLAALVGVHGATEPWPQLHAYLPISMTLIMFCEAITGYLLASQFVIGRQPILLLLSLAYLFDLLMAGSYLLSFPGVFAPFNPLGAQSQTPVLIWMFWTWGFSFWIFAAVLARRFGPGSLPVGGASWLWLLVPVLMAVLLVQAALQAEHWLAEGILSPGGKIHIPRYLVISTWGLNLLALLAVLLTSNLRRVFDLFLLVSALAMFGYAVMGSTTLQRFSTSWYLAGVMKTIASAGLLVALLWEVGRLYRDLQDAHRGLMDVSQRDGLTGIYNRRYLEQQLEQEFQRASRSGLPLSVIMLDVDYFKPYNDCFGHQQGDACLRAIAGVLANLCQRSGDFVARYGGEEFMLVFPGTDSAGGLRIAESARMAVLGLGLPAAAEQGGLVSLSAGVATQDVHADYAETAALIAAADAALYLAKRQGRNRVCLASGPPPAA